MSRRTLAKILRQVSIFQREQCSGYILLKRIRPIRAVIATVGLSRTVSHVYRARDDREACRAASPGTAREGRSMNPRWSSNGLHAGQLIMWPVLPVLGMQRMVEVVIVFFVMEMVMVVVVS